MIDGVPGCLPSKKSRPKLRPGLSRDRVSAKVEGKLTQNPEYAAGAIFLALTVTQSASLPAEEVRGIRLESVEHFSNWNVVLAGDRIFHCQLLPEAATQGLSRAGLPRAAIFLEGPAQMSHQSYVQRCVRRRENIHFVFMQGALCFPVHKMKSSLRVGSLQKWLMGWRVLRILNARQQCAVEKGREPENVLAESTWPRRLHWSQWNSNCG